MNYKTVTRMTDYGPFIVKLILELPCEVTKFDLHHDTFNVYTIRKEKTGEILMRQERGEDKAFESVGYQDVLNIYPCTPEGKKVYRSSFAALDLAEERLSKTIEGNVAGSRYLNVERRITQIRPLPGIDHDVTGLIYDTCTENLSPDTKGWSHAKTDSLNYAFYTPEHKEGKKLPLIIWLHGGGEGGDDILVAYTGNRVTALSSHDIQKYYGKAYVLAPQSPTFWMDDGKEKLGRSNQSIYVKSVKEVIDTFLADHPDVDLDRVYITGISNGGFMTVRMLLDYPGFFAGAIAGCTPFFKENVTEEVVETLKDVPLWLIHAKGDELVDPYETAIPLYKAVAPVSDKIHFSLMEEVVDPTGQYKDELGRPKKIFNHGVWVSILDDVLFTEFDGTRVMESEPVSAWEWLSRQKKSAKDCKD